MHGCNTHTIELAIPTGQATSRLGFCKGIAIYLCKLKLDSFSCAVSANVIAFVLAWMIINRPPATALSIKV
jgi:hypothetical protein